MFVGKAGAYPNEAPFMCSSVGSWPHPETLDYSGKACYGHTL